MEAKMQTQKIIPGRTEVYLEGPKPRAYELIFGFKVLWQFIKAFRTLHFVGPCITVFGSARFKEEHDYYKAAYEAGKKLQHLALPP